MVYPRCLGIGLLVLAVVALGCDEARQKAVEQEQSNIKPLATLYGQYVARHQGKAPANEAELKEFIRSLGDAQRSMFGVTDVDRLFLSSRDQKPYVVAYGEAAKERPPGLAGDPVVIYEQQGVDGKRLVASAMGAVEEVDAARFKQLVPDAPSEAVEGK